MSKKANACPRCLTVFASTDKEDGGIHTCTPTPAWRELEAGNARLRKALEYIAGRLQLDVDDGGRPDQWSMEDMIRMARAALNGDTLT